MESGREKYGFLKIPLDAPEGYVVRCRNCNYTATFDRESLAQSAREMHEHTGHTATVKRDKIGAPPVPRQ